jgi:DNA-binding response OmpR family regulator
MDMRVLIVEDDRALGEFLKKGMQREGHSVEWVEDGEAALAHADALSPDLIVLDLSLPRMDGMEVLDGFRARRLDAAVLVLTGRNELDARVRCLDMGADDCLLKPFSFAELTARSRALLRRREKTVEPVLRHGDLEMNRVERRVLRRGRVVDLTAKEFALLEHLLLHRGQCVSRADLMEQVWQMPSTGGTNVVDVYVNYLRRKLAAACPEGPHEELIETVRGAGYRLGGLPLIARVRIPSRSVAASACA